MRREQEIWSGVGNTVLIKLQNRPTSLRARGGSLRKILGAVVFTSFVLLPVHWQPSMTATFDPETEKVVDASGNLRVPGDYRTAYEHLGNWAVAADQGPGAKQIHTVYASPGTTACTARARVLQMVLCW